jgi:hypothetical protein
VLQHRRTPGLTGAPTTTSTPSTPGPRFSLLPASQVSLCKTLGPAVHGLPCEQSSCEAPIDVVISACRFHVRRQHRDQLQQLPPGQRPGPPHCPQLLSERANTKLSALGPRVLIPCSAVVVFEESSAACSQEISSCIPFIVQHSGNALACARVDV